MTHDELLARIKEGQWVDRQEMMVRSNALRAVVELCNFLDKKGHCCVPVKEVIQAIEKEING